MDIPTSTYPAAEPSCWAKTDAPNSHRLGNHHRPASTSLSPRPAHRAGVPGQHRPRPGPITRPRRPRPELRPRPTVLPPGRRDLHPDQRRLDTAPIATFALNSSRRIRGPAPDADDQNRYTSLTSFAIYAKPTFDAVAAATAALDPARRHQPTNSRTQLASLKKSRSPIHSRRSEPDPQSSHEVGCGRAKRGVRRQVLSRLTYHRAHGRSHRSDIHSRPAN